MHGTRVIQKLIEEGNDDVIEDLMVAQLQKDLQRFMMHANANHVV